MRREDVENRKKYIQKIRSSFEDKPYARWESDEETKGEAQDGFSFFKVRLLLAVFIFTAYVLCDQTGTKFYQFSTKDIAEKIEESYDYTNVEKYVTMLTQNNMF